MTVHVEEALLILNRWRNSWLEGLVPLEEVLHAKSWRFTHTTGGPESARDDYLRCLPFVCNFARQLKHSGRKTALTCEERQTLQSLIQNARPYNMPAVTIASLTTLLLDYPEIVHERAAEVSAAHPSYLKHQNHQMLGHEHLIQNEYFRDPAVMLLQLDSDVYGPRFQWWDMGKLTFWISPDDLARRRFDLAKAEIEGY